MGLIKASMWSEPAHEWLINGLVSSAITVISGEPKVGKSLFIGEAVESLILQKPFLGIEPYPGRFNVAWMGFDSYWGTELKNRFPHICDNLFLQNGIRYDKNDDWRQLSDDLISNQIRLFVVDHLYGLGEGLDLDESHEWDKAVFQLKFVANKLGIPVVLIAQAGKSGTGRAAHTISIEGTARHFLRLTGDLRTKRRKLEIAGNYSGHRTIRLGLTEKGFNLLDSDSEVNESTRKRTGIGIEKIKILLDEAPIEVLSDNASAGRWLMDRGLFRTSESGRSFINKQISGQTIIRTKGPNSTLIRGPKLLT